MSTSNQEMGKVTAHDTLVYRLSQLLMKLNRGEQLHVHALAAEFGVNHRTIQRDLNERLGELPLVRQGSGYAMDPAHLDKYQLRDLQRFARTAGVDRLFPDLLGQFRDAPGAAVSVRGHEYESLAGLEHVFARLERAILDRTKVNFSYRKPGGEIRNFEAVEPYRLVNQNGIWYLLARRGADLKTCAFTRMRDISSHGEKFTHDPAVDQEIDANDSIWFGGQKTRVLVQVDPDVANFFERRKLLPGQTISRKNPDGSLMLEAWANHREQVLPVVRYWVPHLRILEPVEWQEALEISMQRYLASGDIACQKI